VPRLVSASQPAVHPDRTRAAHPRRQPHGVHRGRPSLASSGGNATASWASRSTASTQRRAWLAAPRSWGYRGRSPYRRLYDSITYTPLRLQPGEPAQLVSARIRASQDDW